MGIITWLTSKNIILFLELQHFVNFVLQPCKQAISKSIKAIVLKLDRLIGDDEYMTWLTVEEKI